MIKRVIATACKLSVDSPNEQYYPKHSVINFIRKIRNYPKILEKLDYPKCSVKTIRKFWLNLIEFSGKIVNRNFRIILFKNFGSAGTFDLLIFG